MIVIVESPLRAQPGISTRSNILFARGIVRGLYRGSLELLPVRAENVSAGMDEDQIRGLTTGEPPALLPRRPQFIWASHLMVPPLLGAPSDDSDEELREIGLGINATASEMFRRIAPVACVFGVNGGRVSVGMAPAIRKMAHRGDLVLFASERAVQEANK